MDHFCVLFVLALFALSLTLNVNTVLGTNKKLVPWSADVLDKEIILCSTPPAAWSAKEMKDVCRDGHYKGVKEAADPVIVSYNLNLLPYEGWFHLTLNVSLPKPATKVILIERIAIQAVAVATSTFVGRFTTAMKCQDTWDKANRGQSSKSTSKIKKGKGKGAITSPAAYYCNEPVHKGKNKAPVVPNLERAQMFTMTNVNYKGGELHLDFNVNTNDRTKIQNGAFYFLSFIAVHADYSGKLKKICLVDQRSSTVFTLPKATWPTFNSSVNHKNQKAILRQEGGGGGCPAPAPAAELKCHEFGIASSSTKWIEKYFISATQIRDPRSKAELAAPLPLPQNKGTCDVGKKLKSSHGRGLFDIGQSIFSGFTGAGLALLGLGADGNPPFPQTILTPEEMEQKRLEFLKMETDANRPKSAYFWMNNLQEQQDKMKEDKLELEEQQQREKEKLEKEKLEKEKLENEKLEKEKLEQEEKQKQNKDPILAKTPRKKPMTEKPFSGVREIPLYIKDPNAVIPVEIPVKQAGYGLDPEEGEEGSEGIRSMQIQAFGLSVNGVYSGCGKKKGCVGDPGQCIKHKSCQSIISFGEDDLLVRFQIMGKAGKYVAIGLSKDLLMGNDSVVECVREYGTQINAYVSWNYERNVNKRETDHSAISGVKGAYLDGYIICEFWRKIKTEFHNHTFDLGKETFHILHALGNSATEGLRGNVGYHGEGSTATKAEYQLNKRFEKKKLRLHLEKLHSSLMIVAWLFCFPLAAFLARYFKETYTNKEIRGYTIWYSWHMILTFIGAGMTFLAMVSISAGSGWLVGQGPNQWNYHNKTGMALVAIVVVELVTGCLIYVFNTRFKCQVANYIHGFCGHASFFIAYANMYNSTTFDNGLPCSGATLLIIWLVMYIVIHLLMSYQVCYVDFVRGYYVSRAYNIFHVRAIPHPADEDITGSPVRKIFLCMFTTFSIFVTLAMVGSYIFVKECKDTSLE